MNVLLVSCDKLNELMSGAVTDTEPDNLGWMTIEQTPLLKIGVLRNDGEAVRTGILPNVLVRKATQPALADVRAVGKERRQHAG